jgi:hypothetical protein
VAAALLSKARAELTSQQAQIVDTLKRQCPGFAVMRKLVFSFRAILRGGKVTTLHRFIPHYLVRPLSARFRLTQARAVLTVAACRGLVCQARSADMLRGQVMTIRAIA